jgi:2-keto-4-pentenoate hydratase
MRPVSAQFTEATIDDAYAIQRAWVAIRLAQGHRVLGHKFGLTSKAMQSQSSVKEPDYGCLLDDTMVRGRHGDPRRVLHRTARRGRARLRSEQAAVRARLHDL